MSCFIVQLKVIFKITKKRQRKKLDQGNQSSILYII